MKEIISRAKEITVFYDNNRVEINNIRELISELLNGSYSTPSYIIADNDEILKAKEKGLWIEFIFDSTEHFKEYPFDSLLIQLKSGYNFLSFIRKIDCEYSGKAINFNLSTKTTPIYKEILKQIKG